jgi:hypothetical protein
MDKEIGELVNTLKELLRWIEAATPGPWRVGKNHSVVCDKHDTRLLCCQTPENGSSDVGYYGGHIICESISKANAEAVARVPTIGKHLRDLITRLERPGN